MGGFPLRFLFFFEEEVCRRRAVGRMRVLLQLKLQIIINLGLLLHEEIDAHWWKLSSVLIR
jgi:hypothetical protein